MAKIEEKKGYLEEGTLEKEKTALWAHQGDDDLPNPRAVKLNRRKRCSPVRFMQVKAKITPAERKRLERLQRRHQLSFVGWLRYAMSLDESIRPREAHDYIRRIIPEAVAVIAERELTVAAEGLMAVASRQNDRIARRNLNQDAGLILDAAAWFTEIRHDYERMHPGDAPGRD